MKSRMIATFAALSLVATPLAPALAKSVKDEVTLHIETSVQVPPDKVTLPLTITSQGETKAAAETGLAEQERQVRQELGELGIDAAKIKPGKDVSFVTMAGACAAADAAMEAAPAAAPKRGKSRPSAPYANCGPELVEASKTLLVEADGPATIERVFSSPLAEMIGSGRRSMQFTQTDPIAARKKARAEALAKARAEADGYAEAMGYRVVRIERVSNARPSMNMSDLISFIATIDDRSNRMQPSWFAATVTESVAIDFVIAPK
jgi:uncharacterized protein YggE